MHMMYAPTDQNTKVNIWERERLEKIQYHGHWLFPSIGRKNDQHDFISASQHHAKKSNCWKKKIELAYIVLPLDFVGPGLGCDLALKVDVVAFLDGGRVQGRTKLELDHGQIWKSETCAVIMKVDTGHPIWYFWILAGSRKINKVISLVDVSPSNFPTINKRIVQVQQQNRGSLSFTLVFIVTKVTSFWLINLKNLIQNQHRFSDVERRLRNLLWTPCNFCY